MSPANRCSVLAVGLLTVATGAFHELGHATAAHVGGAKPGRIGVGIYFVWPVLFSDLNDSYRLSRAARIRADLGGVYFNGVFMLSTAAAYAITGAPLLPLVIVLHNALVLRQFIPFVRFDGYYLLADLAGVPDLRPYVRPTLGSGRLQAEVVSWMRSRPGCASLVTAWVLTTVATTAGMVLLLIGRVPTLAQAAWRFTEGEMTLVVALLGDGDSRGFLGALRFPPWLFRSQACSYASHVSCAEPACVRPVPRIGPLAQPAPRQTNAVALAPRSSSSPSMRV